jgi:hypothetical protein
MWQAHLSNYRKKHPGIPLKDCMKAASLTYKSASFVHATSAEQAFLDKARELGITGSKKKLKALFEYVRTPIPAALVVPATMPHASAAPSHRVCKQIKEGTECSDRKDCRWVSRTSGKSFCRTAKNETKRADSDSGPIPVTSHMEDTDCHSITDGTVCIGRNDCTWISRHTKKSGKVSTHCRKRNGKGSSKKDSPSTAMLGVLPATIVEELED